MSYSTFSDILRNVKKTTFTLPTKYNLSINQLIKSEDVNIVSNSTYMCGTGYYDYSECKYNNDIKNYIQFGTLNENSSIGFVNIANNMYSIACNIPQSNYRLCSVVLDTTANDVTQLSNSGFRLNLYGFYLFYDPLSYSDFVLRYISYDGSNSNNITNNSLFVTEQKIINEKYYIFLKHVASNRYVSLNNNKAVLVVNPDINYCLTNTDLGDRYTKATKIQFGDINNILCLTSDINSNSVIPINQTNANIYLCSLLYNNYYFIQEKITDPLLYTNSSFTTITNIISYTSGFIYRVYEGNYNGDPTWFSTATLKITGVTYDISSLINNLNSNSIFATIKDEFSIEIIGFFKPLQEDYYIFYIDYDLSSAYNITISNTFLWFGDNAISGYNVNNSYLNSGKSNSFSWNNWGWNYFLSKDTYYPFRMQYGYTKAANWLGIIAPPFLSFSYRIKIFDKLYITDGTKYFYRNSSTSIPTSYLYVNSTNQKNKITTKYYVSTQVSSSPSNLQVVMSGDKTYRMVTVKNTNILYNIQNNLQLSILANSNMSWNKICSSYDGNLQLLASDNNLYRFINKNSLINITSSTFSSTLNWTSVAMSKDGKFQVAVGLNTYLYISSDYGVTWIDPEINVSSKIVNSRTRLWKDVAINSNGMIQIAICTPSVQMWYEYKNYNTVYITYNRGFNWNEVNISGINNTQYEWDYFINTVKISDEGDFMFITSKDRIYYSRDYGNTWENKYFSDLSLPIPQMLTDNSLTPSTIIPFRYIFAYFPINLTGNTNISKNFPYTQTFIITVYDEYNKVIQYKNWYTCSGDFNLGTNTFIDPVNPPSNAYNINPYNLNSKLLIDLGKDVRVSKIEISSRLSSPFRFAYFWCLSSTQYSLSELLGTPTLNSDGQPQSYNLPYNLDTIYMSYNPSSSIPLANFNPFTKGVVYTNTYKIENVVNTNTYNNVFYPFGLKYFEDNLICDMSVNGKFITLARTNGLIYFSTDFGFTFNVLNSTFINPNDQSTLNNSTSKLWNSVSMSKDGSSIFLCDLQNIYYININNIELDIYKISKYSKSLVLNTTYNLSKIYNVIKNWQCISISANGINQLAAVFGEAIYSSIDSGISWTINTSVPTNARWTCVLVSKNGNYRYACHLNGFVYRSVGNSNFIKINSEFNIPKLWANISCSSDGKYVLVLPYGDTALYSFDYGVTFSSFNFIGSNNNWSGSYISSSGQFQIMGEYNGSVFMSFDFGNNWNKVNNLDNLKVKQIKMSGDGRVVIIILFDRNPLISKDRGYSFTELFSSYKYRGCYQDEAASWTDQDKFYPYRMFFTGAYSIKDCYNYALSVGAPTFSLSNGKCYYTYDTLIPKSYKVTDELCKYDLQNNKINNIVSGYPMRNAIYNIENNYLSNYFIPTNGSTIVGGINGRYIVISTSNSYSIFLSELRVFDTANQNLNYIVYQTPTSFTDKNFDGASALSDTNIENIDKVQNKSFWSLSNNPFTYLIVDLGRNQNIRVIDFFNFICRLYQANVSSDFGTINIKIVDSDQTTLKYSKSMSADTWYNTQFTPTLSVNYVNSVPTQATATLHRLILYSNESRTNIFRWTNTTSTPLPTENDYKNSLLKKVFSGWNGTSIITNTYTVTYPSFYRLKIKQKYPYINKSFVIKNISMELQTKSTATGVINAALNRPVLVNSNINSDGLITSNNVCCNLNDNNASTAVYTGQSTEGDTFFIIDLTAPSRTSCTNSCNLLSTYRSIQPAANPTAGWTLVDFNYIEIYTTTQNTDPQFDAFTIELLDINYKPIYRTNDIVPPSNNYLKFTSTTIFNPVPTNEVVALAPLFPSLSNLYYSAVAISENAERIFLSVNKGLIYYSDDFGNSWSPYGTTQKLVVMPPNNLTSFPTTNFQGYNYTVSARTGNNLAQNAFNNSSLSWRSDNNTFTNGTSTTGQWVQIQLPYAIYLNKYEITPDQLDFLKTAPNTFAIMGSNNGTEWDLVDKQFNQIFISSDTVPYLLNTPNKSYSYYRLIIYSIGGSGSAVNTYTQVSGFTLYGMTDIYNSQENTAKEWNDIDTTSSGNVAVFAVNNNAIYQSSTTLTSPSILLTNPNKFISLNVNVNQLLNTS